MGSVKRRATPTGLGGVGVDGPSSLLLVAVVSAEAAAEEMGVVVLLLPLSSPLSAAAVLVVVVLASKTAKGCKATCCLSLWVGFRMRLYIYSQVCVSIESNNPCR